jgi:hypothetical protein
MKIFLALITLLLFDFRNNDLQVYCNDRFGFCVQYPKTFTGQGEAENGDGQIFFTHDKTAEIRAYGMLMLEDVNETIEEEYASAARSLQVSYKVVKSDWFIVSGLDKTGKIVYRKTAKKKIRYMREDEANTIAYQTLMITYPKEQQGLYGNYCKEIAKSF